ncbi:hypothetical protein A1O1_01797 [Capronia coronata CBS 617.96]|uniref:AB hydrolase-1 domain-containing protein n=1 Tax=Capronia coronata CBS 617.96 TaxID=1182541 RepID=W9YUR4_9EURO|nr:uncharacterized protein A1O1_01797 [Capronia coronata CBS 617.96]EXJ93405.1 hypothetical protein A1O1_01797 [Capronia coronata CBS 617.96]
MAALIVLTLCLLTAPLLRAQEVKLQSLLGTLDNNVEFQTAYRAPWQTMPQLPPMPAPKFNGTASVNGIDLWYAIYGADLVESQAQGHAPVVFLHGGFANSDYFSYQVDYLKDGPHTLITIDSRAQGRSTDDTSQPITFDIITQDVVALMDLLQVERFSTVGWSDGACTSFGLAMNYSQRIDRVFAFGATYNPENINATVMETHTFQTYMEWVQKEYKIYSPSSASFEDFEKRLLAMWSSEPHWSAESFQKIPSRFDNPNAPIIWIVAGDSEEAVTRTTPGILHDWIWGSSLVVLPSVGHFA